MKMMWFSTFTVCGRLKVAVTELFAFNITVQVTLVLLQAPVQPAKNAPLPGAAVSFTFVPALNDAPHVGAQLIPAGVLVTVPVELPASVTDS